MVDDLPAASPRLRRRFPVRAAVLLLMLILIGVGYGTFRDRLTLAYLAEHETTLRDWMAAHPLTAYCLAFAIYVLVTGLHLPGATALTLATAWLFGFWRAVVLVSFASTTGATVAFLLSRYLFRDAILRKFGPQLGRFQEALEREGAFYLFTLRLIPAVPFFMINVVMGLTPLKTRTFWWVSQVGMLPGTMVYVAAGAAVPSLRQLAEEGGAGLISPPLIAALVLLGLFPLAVKRGVAWWRKRQGNAAGSAAGLP
jgi:uncharacterized membrane protein YdjX (TVP38/TMEM64 family)